MYVFSTITKLKQCSVSSGKHFHKAARNPVSSPQVNYKTQPISTYSSSARLLSPHLLRRSTNLTE